METIREVLPQSQTSTPASSAISFQTFDHCPGWEMAPEWVAGLIDRHGSRDILEIGSGANPTLAPEDISKRGLRYVANDIDIAELDKADPVFDRWVGDIGKGAPSELENRFDLVFSRMVNEHVEDGRAYHANIHKILRPGGISAHCFSTLYTLPFLVNRLIPERVSDAILHYFDPRDRYQRAKFRAYYSWGRGPSPRMLKKYDSLGFDVVSYVGYFGHGYYWRWPPIDRLEQAKARYLVSNPIPALCSFAMLIARKRSSEAF